MPNCDWGRACNCRECTESMINRITKCSYCDNKHMKVIIDYECDRKGIGSYKAIGLCEEHYKQYLEEKKKKKKEYEEYMLIGKNLYAKFLHKLLTMDVVLKPIKIINNYKSIRENKYNIYESMNKDVLSIQKIKRRWYINESAVKLFLELGLDEFYSIDFRRYHL